MTDTANSKRVRVYDDTCDNCGETKPREQLRTKSVRFRKIGPSGAVVRSRTISWLCLQCMELDEDYRRPGMKASPGVKKGAGFVTYTNG